MRGSVSVRGMSAFGLYLASKLIYAVAAFGSFHALRSHRLPVLFFLLIALSGAAVFASTFSKPWRGREISSVNLNKVRTDTF